jgi:pimeloyl-ACP methyl ester carboxylesterase
LFTDIPHSDLGRILKVCLKRSFKASAWKSQFPGRDGLGAGARLAALEDMLASRPDFPNGSSHDTAPATNSCGFYGKDYHMKRLIFASLTSLPAATANMQTEPPYPAPGRMIDIGGWKVHLHCTGEAKPAQPTVILEAGAGDFSVEWALVQPRVAGFARVCSYDRAGDGWSELGPHPRTMKQLVYELHSLLEKSGERAPYLLIGQSFGGVVVRLYASTCPAEVAGMMLIDAGRLDPWRFINGKLVQFNTTAAGKPVPAVKTANPLRESDIPPDARQQMEAAARSLVTGANESRDKLPLEAQRMRTWALGTSNTLRHT